MIPNEDLRPSPCRLLLTACCDFLEAWNRLREVRVAVAQLLSYTSAARGSIWLEKSVIMPMVTDELLLFRSDLLVSLKARSVEFPSQ